MPQKSSRKANAAQIAHNLSLATWLGGSVFGKFVLNPAVKILSSEEERGKVLNNAWARYELVSMLAVGGAVISWLGLRPEREEAGEDERTAVRVKDILLGTAAACNIGVASVGARFANRAPKGAVPVFSGTRPSRLTPKPAATDQRLLGILENIEVLALIGVVGLSSVLSKEAEDGELREQPANPLSRLRGSRRR